MDKNTELEIIRAALEHPDQLTDEQRELLERNHALLTSPLFRALRINVRLGETEIALAVGKEILRQYAADLPLPRPQCVIYCRVSTEPQTLGSGLTRQLETCQSYARDNGYSILAVFSEVASGAGELPARAQAQRMAVKNNCKLICEDYDGWSRAGVADLPPAYVIMASDSVKMMEDELRQVLSPFRFRLVTGKSM